MRALVAVSRGSASSTRIVPAVGCSRPSSSLIVVLLPEPLGPSSPTTSPGPTERSMPRTAATVGRCQKSRKVFRRPRISMTGGGVFMPQWMSQWRKASMPRARAASDQAAA